MKIAPNYYESHLVVAAIRVLSHTEGRPPTPGEVATLLGLSSEKVHVLVHELGKLEIIRLMESPFDLRIDVQDPVPLEQLPRAVSDAAMTEELADFKEKSREKHDEMQRMFQGGEAERRRKERVSKLEEHFKSFRPKPGQLESLFGGAGGANEDEDEDEDGNDTSDDTSNDTGGATGGIAKKKDRS